MIYIDFKDVETGEEFYYEGQWWTKTHRLGGRRYANGMWIQVDLMPLDRVGVNR